MRQAAILSCVLLVCAAIVLLALVRGTDEAAASGLDARLASLGWSSVLVAMAVLLNEHLKDNHLFSQLTTIRGSRGFEPQDQGTEGGGTMLLQTSSECLVEAVPRRLQDCKPVEWDAFAQAGGASFRSSHGWLGGWSLKSRFRRRLQIFEFYRAGRKVGQCAVGIGRGECVFLDRLVLAPGSETLWTPCMDAVLKCLGPGRYRYGWHLNLEQAREGDVQGVPGVEMEKVRPLTVHAVDFKRWSSWDEYWADTSNNTRRNAKRAEKADLHVETRVGLKCLQHVTAIIRLRSVMYERKGIQFDWIRALLSYVGGHLTSPGHRISAIASEAGQPQAAFIGFEFGTHTYYIAGGSRPSNNGVAWYLQKLMLYRAWERTAGRATYIMGHVDYETHDEAIGGGLLRSRRAVNASDYETSVITFLYRPSPVIPGTRLHSDS